MVKSNTNTGDKMNVHPWEARGLGKAPFRYNGAARTVHVVGVMSAVVQPAGSCAYCGAALSYSCYIKDANGAEFTVGDTCVEKLWTAELDHASRRVLSQAKNALNKAKRNAQKARESARIDAAMNCSDAVRDALDAEPHPTRAGLTLRDWVGFMFQNAGHTGKLKAARVVERFAA